MLFLPHFLPDHTAATTISCLFACGLYLTHAAPDNAAYFAAIQFYFCLTNIYATVMRAVNGIITVDILICAAIGLVGCMIGDALGKIVFDKLDSDKLKTVIYVGMIVSGALMII